MALRLRSVRNLTAALFFVSTTLLGQQAPAAKPVPTEGDYISHNFHFKSGESLPELRLHYTTFGQPERDASGKTTNAVLILHGTGGTGHQFFAPQLRMSCLGRDSRSMRPDTLSFSPTTSVMENRASRAMDFMPIFRGTTTTTWWRRNTSYWRRG